MKKLFLTSLFAATLFSSSAFAKTQGHYLGVDAIGTRTSFYEKVTYTPQVTGVENPDKIKPISSNNAFGLGVNYKYAFNYNNFFIAPGIILEQNSFGSSSTKADSKGNLGERLQVKNRYGLKADFGYDISDKISPYITVGYAIVDYKTISSAFDINDNLITNTKRATDSGVFYGLGVRAALDKNISLSLEYNYQTFSTKGTVPVQAQDYIEKSSQIARLDIIKLGLSYKF